MGYNFNNDTQFAYFLVIFHSDVDSLHTESRPIMMASCASGLTHIKKQ